MSTSAAPLRIPLWTRGDLNASFGFGINMLVNVLVLSGLMLGVVHLDSANVNGVLLPALGIELLIGNVFYFYLARRLGRKEGRTNVTALPYGPSVPHMFIVTLVIMLPIYLETKDPIAAWEAGLAWAFIIGVIILIGAFVGPYIQKFTPRAAMLGTLAGISITFVSMRPAAQMFEALWIALPVFALILIGFVSGVKLPGNLPLGLVALLFGTAIGWIGGYMDGGAIGDAAKDIAVGLPTLSIGRLSDGLSGISPLLATAIPLGIYNFTEAMSNVESAAAAGDKYNLRAVLLADGTGAIVGAALGSPFPPAVYVGHKGWKEAGGRTTYSLAAGGVIALLCFLGMFPVLASILPIPAIVPVLLFIGLVIGGQAFAAVPKAYYAAVVLAMIPNIASWGAGLIESTLSAAGTSVDKVGEQALGQAGALHLGLSTLGNGAVLVGMLLGAIAVFTIDRKFLWAAGYALIGAALSCVGLIHGSEVHWPEYNTIALAYAMTAVVFAAFHFLGVPRREVDLTDPVDVADAALAQHDRFNESEAAEKVAKEPVLA